MNAVGIWEIVAYIRKIAKNEHLMVEIGGGCYFPLCLFSD